MSKRGDSCMRVHKCCASAGAGRRAGRRRAARAGRAAAGRGRAGAGAAGAARPLGGAQQDGLLCRRHDAAPAAAGGAQAAPRRAAPAGRHVPRAQAQGRGPGRQGLRAPARGASAHLAPGTRRRCRFPLLSERWRALQSHQRPSPASRPPPPWLPWRAARRCWTSLRSATSATSATCRPLSSPCCAR